MTPAFTSNPVPSVIFDGSTELTVKNGLLDITFEIKNIKASSDISVYAAVYDGNNKMIRVNKSEKTLAYGSSDKFSMDIDLSNCENTQGYTLKVFVWNNSTIKPLTEKAFTIK